ncbi:MAG: hypothetical protein HQL56_00930 [Magnetococcales bacterium]|nr:hypothetical protein [Magnetococcales bacterium]
MGQLAENNATPSTKIFTKWLIVYVAIHIVNIRCLLLYNDWLRLYPYGAEGPYVYYWSESGPKQHYFMVLLHTLEGLLAVCITLMVRSNIVRIGVFCVYYIWGDFVGSASELWLYEQLHQPCPNERIKTMEDVRSLDCPGGYEDDGTLPRLHRYKWGGENGTPPKVGRNSGSLVKPEGAKGKAGD